VLSSLLILQTGKLKAEFKNIYMHKFLYDCIHHFKFMIMKTDKRVCTSWRSNNIKNKNHRIYPLITMMHFLAQLSLALINYNVYQDFFVLYLDTWHKTKEMALPQHFVFKYHICFLLCHLIVRYNSQPLWLLSYDVMLQHVLIYLTSCMYNYWYYFNTCTVHLLLFCTMTNKCTINLLALGFYI